MESMDRTLHTCTCRGKLPFQDKRGHCTQEGKETLHRGTQTLHTKRNGDTAQRHADTVHEKERRHCTEERRHCTREGTETLHRGKQTLHTRRKGVAAAAHAGINCSFKNKRGHCTR